MFFLYQLITGSMCFKFCSISRKYSKSSKSKFRKFWLCYVIQRLPMTQLSFGTLHLKIRQNRSILKIMHLSSSNNIICRHFLPQGICSERRKKMYTSHASVRWIILIFFVCRKYTLQLIRSKRKLNWQSKILQQDSYAGSTRLRSSY